MVKLLVFATLFICQMISPSANAGGAGFSDRPPEPPSSAGEPLITKPSACLEVRKQREGVVPLTKLLFGTDEGSTALEVRSVRSEPRDPGEFRIVSPVPRTLALGLGFQDQIPSGDPHSTPTSPRYDRSLLHVYDPVRKGYGVITAKRSGIPDITVIRSCVNMGGLRHRLRVVLRQGDLFDGQVVLGVITQEDQNVRALVIDKVVLDRERQAAEQYRRSRTAPLPQQLANRQRAILSATRVITIERRWVLSQALEAIRTDSPSNHQLDLSCEAQKMTVVPEGAASSREREEPCLNLPVGLPGPASQLESKSEMTNDQTQE